MGSNTGRIKAYPLPKAHFFIHLKSKNISETSDTTTSLAWDMDDMQLLNPVDAFCFSSCLSAPLDVVDHSLLETLSPLVANENTILVLCFPVNSFSVPCHLLLHIFYIRVFQNILTFLFLFASIDALCLIFQHFRTSSSTGLSSKCLYMLSPVLRPSHILSSTCSYG